MTVETAPQTHADPTQRAIASMLVEDTGSHFLDSGMYGRAWQVTRAAYGLDGGLPNSAWDGGPKSHAQPTPDDLDRVALAMEAAPYGWIDRLGTVYIDTYHWLVDRLDYDPRLDAKWRRWSDLEDAAMTARHGKWSDQRHSWLEQVEIFVDLLKAHGATVSGLYGDGEPDWCNTYNGECELDRTLQFMMLRVENLGGKREFLPDGTYVMLQVHGGADVRGGYTAPKLFRMGGSDDADMFDFDRVDIWCDGAEMTLDDGIPGQMTMDGEVAVVETFAMNHSWDNSYGDGRLRRQDSERYYGQTIIPPQDGEEVLCLSDREEDIERWREHGAALDYYSPPKSYAKANIATWDEEREVWLCPFDGSPLNVSGNMVG